MGFETLAFPLLVVERETDRRQRRLAPKPPRACAIRGCSSSLLLALLWISAERDGAASTLSVQWGSLHEKQRPESLLAASANVSLFFPFWRSLRSLPPWMATTSLSTRFLVSSPFSPSFYDTITRTTSQNMSVIAHVDHGAWDDGDITGEGGSFKSVLPRRCFFSCSLASIDGPTNDGGWPCQSSCSSVFLALCPASSPLFVL